MIYLSLIIMAAGDSVRFCNDSGHLSKGGDSGDFLESFKSLESLESLESKKPRTKKQWLRIGTTPLWLHVMESLSRKVCKCVKKLNKTSEDKLFLKEILITASKRDVHYMRKLAPGCISVNLDGRGLGDSNLSGCVQGLGCNESGVVQDSFYALNPVAHPSVAESPHPKPRNPPSTLVGGVQNVFRGAGLGDFDCALNPAAHPDSRESHPKPHSPLSTLVGGVQNVFKGAGLGESKIPTHIPIHIIEGGDSRFASLKNALKFIESRFQKSNGESNGESNEVRELDSHYVIVNDCARFNTKKRVLYKMLKAVCQRKNGWDFDCVAPYIGVSDTVVYENESEDSVGLDSPSPTPLTPPTKVEVGLRGLGCDSLESGQGAGSQPLGQGAEGSTPLGWVAGFRAQNSKQDSKQNSRQDSKDKGLDSIYATNPVVHPESTKFSSPHPLTPPERLKPCSHPQRLDSHPRKLTHIKRENLRLIQTPQISKTSLLLESMKLGIDFSDESSAINALPHTRIKLVKGDVRMGKLTTKSDLPLLSPLLSPLLKRKKDSINHRESNILIGQGSDIHAFEYGTGKEMWLCGVRIESNVDSDLSGRVPESSFAKSFMGGVGCNPNHSGRVQGVGCNQKDAEDSKALDSKNFKDSKSADSQNTGIKSISFKAHSDGDVGLHALIDSILGAMNCGDIGEIFPDSDPQFKGADSKILLRRVYDYCLSTGLVLANVDITLIAQMPKITPYKSQMQEAIAAILSLRKSQVSIKATTAEHLGFIGRKEGVLAHCIAQLNVREVWF